MAATNRYAVVVKVRRQVSGFVSNPEVVSQDIHIVIDMENHPQFNEVDVDWYYDETTNTFSVTEGSFPSVYAEVNEYDVVQNIMVSNTEPTESNYVPATKADPSIIGMVHYKSNFIPMIEAIWNKLVAR